MLKLHKDLPKARPAPLHLTVSFPLLPCARKGTPHRQRTAAGFGDPQRVGQP
jgi:hypothetical protein